MLSPLALLWFLPIGGAITLLYLLKQKRQDVRVPSLMLWEQVLSPAATASPFQRLRIDPLLLLQLLAVLLLCLALARPFVWGQSIGGRSIAIVIDTSASMEATDVPGGRLQAAIGEARKIIETKAPTDNIALVLAGVRPVVLAPLSSDTSRLLSALGKVEASNTITGPREALLLASGLVSSRPEARVTLITDGAFPRQDELSLAGAVLSTVTVGKGSNNLGITAFDAREKGDGNGTEAFVTVLNADTKPHIVPLTIRINNTLVEAREITIPSGETRSLVIPIASAAIPKDADLLSAHIEASDDLSVDNEAFAALPNRAPVRVLLVSSGDDPFLERALSLVSRVAIQRATPSAFATRLTNNQDLIVWDSDVTPPVDLPAGRYLFFGGVPTGAIAPVISRGESAGSPPVLDWDRASPLLRFADLSGVRIRSARKVTPASWASIAVESRSIPLIVVGERGETRIAYVAFRPQQSDFPLRVAFPVFISNAVAYLVGNTNTDQSPVLRPGDTIALPRGARVTDGNGKFQPSSGDVFGGTQQVGIYTITSASGVNNRFAVSLLSPSETQITPNPSPQIIVTDTQNENKDSVKPRKSPQEWGMYFAVPLLLLLMVEWWLHFRRK